MEYIHTFHWVWAEAGIEAENVTSIEEVAEEYIAVDAASFDFDNATNGHLEVHLECHYYFWFDLENLRLWLNLKHLTPMRLQRSKSQDRA